MRQTNLAPQVLKAAWRELGIAHDRLDAAVPEVRLQRPRICAPVFTVAGLAKLMERAGIAESRSQDRLQGASAHIPSSRKLTSVTICRELKHSDQTIKSEHVGTDRQRFLCVRPPLAASGWARSREGVADPAWGWGKELVAAVQGRACSPPGA